LSSFNDLPLEVTFSPSLDTKSGSWVRRLCAGRGKSVISTFLYSLFYSPHKLHTFVWNKGGECMDQRYDLNGYNQKVSTPNHDVRMIGRKNLEITGVKQVESFDNEEFLLETTMGFLAIRGTNLKMKNLDVESGVVNIEGKVFDLVYLDQQTGEKNKGFFGKLFK
jgi:sporulation protein YabP